MCLALPKSRFGIFYAGPIFMLGEFSQFNYFVRMPTVTQRRCVIVENPHGVGRILITSPLSAVNTPITDPLKDSSLPYPLPSAPIIACFVALACQHLQGFDIDPLTSPIPNLALQNTIQRGGNGNGGNGRLMSVARTRSINQTCARLVKRAPVAVHLHAKSRQL